MHLQITHPCVVDCESDMLGVLGALLTDEWNVLYKGRSGDGADRIDESAAQARVQRR
jgi:hypothetical protein